MSDLHGVFSGGAQRALPTYKSALATPKAARKNTSSSSNNGAKGMSDMAGTAAR